MPSPSGATHRKRLKDKLELLEDSEPGTPCAKKAEAMRPHVMKVLTQNTGNHRRRMKKKPAATAASATDRMSDATDDDDMSEDKADTTGSQTTEGLSMSSASCSTVSPALVSPLSFGLSTDVVLTRALVERAILIAEAIDPDNLPDDHMDGTTLGAHADGGCRGAHGAGGVAVKHQLGDTTSHDDAASSYTRARPNRK